MGWCINEPVFRTEFAEEIIDLSIDNGKKSKRLLTVIENFNSVISNGWANGKMTFSILSDVYLFIKFRHRLFGGGAY